METVPEAVDSETSTEVEKSDTTEATLSTSKVETPDIPVIMGYPQKQLLMLHLIHL